MLLRFYCDYITAVIDLNGRFFGGREVKARFFDQDKFENLDLTD